MVKVLCFSVHILIIRKIPIQKMGIRNILKNYFSTGKDWEIVSNVYIAEGQAISFFWSMGLCLFLITESKWDHFMLILCLFLITSITVYACLLKIFWVFKLWLWWSGEEFSGDSCFLWQMIYKHFKKKYKKEKWKKGVLILYCKGKIIC